MTFNEPKVELVEIELAESAITTSNQVCTPNNGQPGGGWHCSNNAWAYNNCLDQAPVIC